MNVVVKTKISYIFYNVYLIKIITMNMNAKLSIRLQCTSSSLWQLEGQ